MRDGDVISPRRPSLFREHPFISPLRRYYAILVSLRPIFVFHPRRYTNKEMLKVVKRDFRFVLQRRTRTVPKSDHITCT